MYENSMELIYQAQNGDQEAMTKIVEENKGLVWSIVKRFSQRGYELDDLYQIGSLGFIKAVKNSIQILKLDFLHMLYHIF